MTVKKPSKAKKVTKAPIKPEVLSVDESSPEVEAENIAGPEKYYESVGRRKESIARVRLFTKKASDSQQAESSELAILTINGKNYLDYFKDVRLQHLIEAAGEFPDKPERPSMVYPELWSCLTLISARNSRNQDFYPVILALKSGANTD